MAGKRLSKRREIEAAEAMDADAAPAKKKVAKKKAAKKKAAPRARKKKSEMPPRRRLVWVVYSSTMREEGRFLYHERDKAEEKLNALLAKGKRRYFIQPIKEPLDSEGNPMLSDDDKPKKTTLAPEVVEAEAEAEAEVDTDEPEVDAAPDEPLPDSDDD